MLDGARRVRIIERIDAIDIQTIAVQPDEYRQKIRDAFSERLQRDDELPEVSEPKPGLEGDEARAAVLSMFKR